MLHSTICLTFCRAQYNYLQGITVAQACNIELFLNNAPVTSKLLVGHVCWARFLHKPVSLPGCQGDFLPAESFFRGYQVENLGLKRV